MCRFWWMLELNWGCSNAKIHISARDFKDRPCTFSFQISVRDGALWCRYWYGTLIANIERRTTTTKPIHNCFNLEFGWSHAAFQCANCSHISSSVPTRAKTTTQEVQDGCASCTRVSSTSSFWFDHPLILCLEWPRMSSMNPSMREQKFWLL